MNRLIVFRFVFIVSIINLEVLCNSSVAFGGGAGTEQNPYQIYTRKHLEELADSVNNGYYWSHNKFFHLMNDIEDSVKTVIGFVSTNSTPELVCFLRRSTQKKAINDLRRNRNKYNLARTFQGYFNGKGHKITLSIRMPSRNNVGLFGVISGNGLVVDLDVDGIVVGNYNVGGVVGCIRKSFNENSFYMISGCINYASISAIRSKGPAGAIVGNIMGHKNNIILIDRCLNYGSVSTNDDLKYYNYSEEDIGGIKGLVGAVSPKLIFRYINYFD